MKDDDDSTKYFLTLVQPISEASEMPTPVRTQAMGPHASYSPFLVLPTFLRTVSAGTIKLTWHHQPPHQGYITS